MDPEKTRSIPELSLSGARGLSLELPPEGGVRWRAGFVLGSVRTKITIPGCFVDRLLYAGRNRQELRHGSRTQKPGRGWEYGALRQSKYRSKDYMSANACF